MNKMIDQFSKLLKGRLPHCVIEVDAPAKDGGNWWLDVGAGKRRFTIEYRFDKGFGLFHGDAGYGGGPSEIYRTPQRVVQRLTQLMTARGDVGACLNLKDIRELYGQSQVTLAKRAGVRQPAISRFEKRGEVKLSTLAATIKALGGRLEVRAHFKDADVPISLSSAKK